MRELQEPMMLLLHTRQTLQRYEATLSICTTSLVCVYGRSSGGVTNIETALGNYVQPPQCITRAIYRVLEMIISSGVSQNIIGRQIPLYSII